MVWGQNNKLGLRRVLYEMIPVIGGLKPAVDAFRVASGAKIEEGQTFDPLNEMVSEFALSSSSTINLSKLLLANIIFVHITRSCQKAYIKCIEMFAEAIPGVIIQLCAIMTDGHASAAAKASLIISAFTTGFVSASLSFDWDVNPQKRIENPEFFGYIPNSANLRVGEITNKKLPANLSEIK